MIRIRTLLCAATAACGLALGFNAFAGTLTLNLSIDGCDTVTPNGNGGYTCAVSSGTGPTASCSLSPIAKSVAIPGTQNVTMTCSNMAGAVGYVWTGGCTTAVGNVCTVTSTQIGTVNVGATASDGTNNISKSTTVVFFDPNAGGGGSGVSIPKTCGDGTSTVATTIRTFDGSGYIADPFAGKQTGVWAIVVPPMAPNSNVAFGWSSSGGQSDQIGRLISISKTACDMKGAIASDGSQFSGNIAGVVNDGTSVVTGRQGTNVMHMMPGDVWYINVQNLKLNGKSSCSISDCPMVIKAQNSS